jgi:hypothetical protein
MIRIARTSNGAPVCPVSRSQAVPGMPGNFRPYVPRAFDLPSAIAAANQAGLLMMIFAGPGMVTNNVFPPLPFGYPLLSRNNSPSQDAGGGFAYSRWRETDRKMGTYKLENRENPENWVKIERIDMIEWEDRKNGTVLRFEFGIPPDIPTTKETKLREKNLYA